jgi:hypothetical protein
MMGLIGGRVLRRVHARFVEFDRAEHVAVIGDGQCRLVHLACTLDDVADARRSVEQTVLRMRVQMTEGWRGHGRSRVLAVVSRNERCVRL